MIRSGSPVCDRHIASCHGLRLPSRLRLDLTVNILTNHAINNGRITVFGGDQLRPNIHIEDMTDLYVRLLEEPDETINGRTWNAGYHNLKVRTIADMVREQVGPSVDIVVTPPMTIAPTTSSEKIRRDLGFVAARTVQDAIFDLKRGFFGRLRSERDD